MRGIGRISSIRIKESKRKKKEKKKERRNKKGTGLGQLKGEMVQLRDLNSHQATNPSSSRFCPSCI